MAQAIRPSLISDQVFRRLCEQVLSGDYAPGEKLPTQRALAAELGVNMASVREAVKRLEQLRLIEVRHGDAMRVRDWRSAGGLDVIAHLLFSAGGLDRAILAELMEARRLMLAEAARLAAERRGPEQAARIVELARGFAAATDPPAAQAVDFAFMAELVEASGNVVFRLILNSIRELYLGQPEPFAGLVARREELAPMYTAAAEAVRERDADGAARAVEELARCQERRLTG